MAFLKCHLDRSLRLVENENENARSTFDQSLVPIRIGPFSVCNVLNENTSGFRSNANPNENAAPEVPNHHYAAIMRTVFSDPDQMRQLYAQTHAAKAPASALVFGERHRLYPFVPTAIGRVLDS